MKRFTPHLRCLLFVLITIAFATRLVADPATKPAVPTPMDDPAMTSLAAYGKRMADAATNGNNSRLLDLMYAPVIDKAGGRDKLLAAMGARQRQLQDKGKTWSFLDGKGGEDLIRDFLPDLPADVKIPERSEAVFTPDAK